MTSPATRRDTSLDVVQIRDSRPLFPTLLLDRSLHRRALVSQPPASRPGLPLACDHVIFVAGTSRRLRRSAGPLERRDRGSSTCAEGSGRRWVQLFARSKPSLLAGPSASGQQLPRAAGTALRPPHAADLPANGPFDRADPVRHYDHARRGWQPDRQRRCRNSEISLDHGADGRSGARVGPHTTHPGHCPRLPAESTGVRTRAGEFTTELVSASFEQQQTWACVFTSTTSWTPEGETLSLGPRGNGKGKEDKRIRRRKADEKRIPGTMEHPEKKKPRAMCPIPLLYRER